MSIRVSLTGRAEADLVQQYRWYLDNAAVGIAERFLSAFDSKVGDLTAHPGLGSPRKFRAPELAGIRSIRLHPPFDRHLIFYRAEGANLTVTRIMHGARDLPRRLIEP